MRDSVRRALALLAMVGLSAFGTLQGCGGGGDGGAGNGGGGSNTNPTAPVPYEFLSVGLTSSDTFNNKTLLLVDADNPGNPRLSINLSDAFTNSPVASYHPTLDASSRTLTDRPPAMVYFVTAGFVYQVSLRKADSTAPQRISSLTTACAVTAVYTLDVSDGPEDSLIEVSERGPDGSCMQSMSDNTTRYVRTGTPATQPAMVLPVGVKVISALPNATGATTFLMGDTRGASPKLAFYSADLAYLGDVSGGSNVATVQVAGAPSSSRMNAAYVREGWNLRLLTWTPTSAALYGSTYTNRSAPSTAGLPAVTDSTAIYFTDGLEVRRKVSSSGTTDLLGTLDAANGTQVALLGASTNHLLLLQATSDGQRNALFSLPKAGGASVNLQSLTSSGVNPLIGTYGDDVVYASTDRIWRARADGTNKQLITDRGSATKFGLHQPTRVWGTAGDIDAVVWCENPNGPGYCLNGTLKSLDLASRTTTTLGAFSHTNAVSWYASSYGPNLTGMPVVLLASASPADQDSALLRKQDMYVAQPGRASSLVKITSQLH